MGIFILFYLSGTLLDFTMIRAMDNQVASAPTNSNSERTPEEFHIFLRKVIDGDVKYNDAGEGKVHRFATEHPDLNDDTIGHVILKLQSGEKYAASLRKIDGYENFGHDGPNNCQRTSYRCEVARKGYSKRLEFTLSHYTQKTTLHGGTLRIEFVNNMGVLFVGESKRNTPEESLPYKKRKTNVPSGPGSSHNEAISLDL